METPSNPSRALPGLLPEGPRADSAFLDACRADLLPEQGGQAPAG